MVSSTNLLAKGQNNKETKLNRITKLTLLGKRTPFPSDCSELAHQSSCLETQTETLALSECWDHQFVDRHYISRSWVSSFLTADNWEVLSLYHFMANRWGKRNSDRLYFLRLQNHYGQWLQPWNQKTLPRWRESYDEHGQCIKKQRHHFANKGP